MAITIPFENIPQSSALRGEKMARLWFGGSFNPIHHGHLICARAVAEASGFEKVVLIPSSQPPHKAVNREIAAAEHRLAMCRLAIEGSELFEVDDVELQRPGPSYTIDTVRELRRRGWPEVHWLIGADMVKILPLWHNPDALLAETRFVVMARPGWTFDWDLLPPAYRHLEQQVVTAPLVEIGATDIRKRVADGKSVDYLIPERVDKYIRENQIYRTQSPHVQN
jgi:nicotinate-nucleotide adenylyltransferase